MSITITIHFGDGDYNSFVWDALDMKQHFLYAYSIFLITFLTQLNSMFNADNI